MVNENELNPWGAPAEGRMNATLCETILAAVRAGVEVVSLMPEKHKAREMRVEKLWTLFSTAEGMILREQGRARRVAARREAEAADLMGKPLIEDDDDEDTEFGGEADYNAF